MFTDQFKHEINSYLKSQGDRLLKHQSVIARTAYNTKTGTLARFLSGSSTVQGEIFGGTGVEVAYPKYIRFLDMKKSYARKKRRYVKKRKYVPIYNKYVYGYLKSDIWKKLMEVVPKHMIQTIESNITDIRHREDERKF